MFYIQEALTLEQTGLKKNIRNGAGSVHFTAYTDFDVYLKCTLDKSKRDHSDALYLCVQCHEVAIK